jgi:hypothetical protein
MKKAPSPGAFCSFDSSKMERVGSPKRGFAGLRAPWKWWVYAPLGAAPP